MISIKSNQYLIGFPAKKYLFKVKNKNKLNVLNVDMNEQVNNENTRTAFINPFSTSVPLLYPLKTSENLHLTVQSQQ